jgi:5-methylcytosine-specific restriction enzyme B
MADYSVPVRRIEIRKRLTNQGNNFASYNWARIYPSCPPPMDWACRWTR